jgi:hypothetical protein
MTFRVVPSCLLAVALAAAGCASARNAPGSVVLRLGEPYHTPDGDLFVIRVQDEFRLIRCIPTGPIAGCYEDVHNVAADRVEYNRWMDVTRVPGLELAIVSPAEVAYRVHQETGPVK